MAILGRWLGAGEMALSTAVVLVVLMMVIPLPSFLLSLLISLNLALSLVLLVAAMQSTNPLDFSVFPSLLLVTTLFRLGLNVSTARLILANGNAGEVIQAFGQFVVGGNPVVGFIIFLILVIIQFVVITRGAERVAEVAARFTLDAMPGKQMSIDADLNAGLIDEAEARRRRREIEREADFYGAMDGASKFVKGDAIAALLIIAINILAGFAIGMWQRGLAWDQALQQYTLLTVGDGLSAQIPALLISTATGIVVTRAASETNLGREVSDQVLGQPRALLMAGGTLTILALVPGLPKLPFLILGLLFLALGRLVQQQKSVLKAKITAAPRTPADAAKESTSATPLLTVDPLEIELGYALVPLADGPDGGEIMARIGAIRRQVALDRGFLLPLVRVRDNVQLPPNAYVVKVRGLEVARGELFLDRLLAMDAGGATATLPGLPTREPAFGLPAVWIRLEDREQAELQGFTVVEPAAVLATHFSELVRHHAPQLLSRQEVKALLEIVREESPAVVEELVPALLSTGQVQRVLQNLLREGLSIRDLPLILEALGDAAVETKHIDTLTERARAALARHITAELPLADGQLPVITLAPELERLLTEQAAGIAALQAQHLGRIGQSLDAALAQAGQRGLTPVVLCAPSARAPFRRLVERTHPDLRVLAYHEIVEDVPLIGIGTVSV